ncbi:MAG: hypothetical protein SGI90_10930 [Candidatus Eisenbacteria bacterium]|nr:hypothetical protein [Candidatus Eisenbacteria bacterium]
MTTFGKFPKRAVSNVTPGGHRKGDPQLVQGRIEPFRTSRMAWVFYGILAMAVLLRAIVALQFYRYFIDDASIFMRFVENFVAGHGLVFNPGERVLGFTSPLFTLVLAGLKSALPSVGIGAIISALNFTLFTMTGVILVRLTLTDKPVSWMLPLVFLFYFPFVDASLNGMETTLMLATLVGTLYLLQRERRDLAVVVAGFAALTRPEGVLFFGLVLAYLIFLKKGPFPVKGFLIASLLGLAWAGAASSYYGTFVPQSMVAKSSHAWHGLREVPNSPYSIHIFLSLALTDTLYQGLSQHVRLLIQVVAGLLTLGFALGFRRFLRERSPLVLAPIFYVVILLLYIIGNPVDLASWHTIPPSVAFFIALFGGLEEVLSRGNARWLQRFVLAAIFPILIASVLWGLPRRARTINDVQGAQRHIVTYVREHVPAATSVATGHIGLIGHESGLRIVDLGALVTPAVMKDLYLSDTLAREKPSVIVLNPTILEDGLDPIYPHPFRTPAEKQAFLETYTPVSEAGRTHLFVDRKLLVQ